MTRKTRRRILRLMSRVPGLYAVVAFALARRVSVRGWSMSPALLPGERLLVDRLAYTRDRPKVGDVVLVVHPLQPGLRMVKRLAALPGETIDGVALKRGEYWMRGDNEDASSDSRQYGPAKQNDLLGRVWVRYWPADAWQVFD